MTQKVEPKLIQSYATAFEHSKGDYCWRLALNGNDNKSKVVAKVSCLFFVELLDRVLHFVNLRDRKWVKVEIQNGDKTQSVLLNVNSLCNRTLLSRDTILKSSVKQLSEMIMSPEIQWDYKNLNDHFPHAYLINLDHRTDRIESLNTHLKTIGESDFKYTRFSAVNGAALPDSEIAKMSKSTSATRNGKDDRRGRYAVYKSHLNVLKEARDKQLPSVLVLEDDVRFAPWHLSHNYLHKVSKELPSDWDMLFLGYYEAGDSYLKHSEHLVRPKVPYDLHAYVVNARMYDRLIEVLEKEFEKPEGEMRAIDVVIAEDIAPSNNTFACKDNVAFQDEGYSSIVNTQILGNYGKEVKRLSDHYTRGDAKGETADGLPVMDGLIAGSLFQMADQMVKIFDKHGIRYWADGGTILGMERHGSLIPHDDDIDVCIYPGDEEKLKLDDVKNDLAAIGLEVKDHWLGAKLCSIKQNPKGCQMHKDGCDFSTPNIDLFFTKVEGDRFVYSQDWAREIWPDYHHLTKNIINENGEFKRQKFGPIEMNSPWNSREYCESYYGKNVMYEAYVQYDHINERPLTRRPVRLTDYRAFPYQTWDELPPLSETVKK